MLLRPQYRQYQDRERFVETARTDLSYLASPSFLAFRLLPYGLSVTSRSIGQPLADSALNRTGGALNVIYALPDAIAIPEIKLRKIAVQMLLAAMLVDALHAAFEDRIVTFNGVGGDGFGFDERLAIGPHLVGDFVPIPNIFLRLVAHGIVAFELATNLFVGRMFVGHQAAFLGDVRLEDWRDIGNRGAVDMEATGRAAPLNEGQDDILVSPAVTLFGDAFQPTDVGFVGFHDLARAAQRADAGHPHGLTDTVRHEPCGLEGYAQGPGKLVAGNALFGRAKQVHRLQPKVHGDVAVLENGADFDGELLPALVTLPEADPGRLAAHLADPLNPAAMRAYRTLGPYPGLNPSDSGGFGLHNLGGKDRLGHDAGFPYLNQGYPR